MVNCLVLGANGFLGSHLVDSLADRGHYVRCFDRFKDNKTKFYNSSKVELYNGEFLNNKDLKSSIKDIDYVFHLISTTTPISSSDNPAIEIETNIRYSIELFNICTQAKVKKVIYVSSGGAVYGDVNESVINETVTPHPISPYGIGKLTVEMFLDYYKHSCGLDSVVYRPSNPYGSRQSLSSRQGVIPIFLQQLLSSQPINIYGDGSMVRDYIYVKDAMEMIATSFESSKSNLYNIGSGNGVSVNDLLPIITETTGLDININRLELPSTFVHKNILDTQRFESEFGKPDLTSLEEGIKLTWEYISSELKRDQ